VFLRAEVDEDKMYLPDFIDIIRDVTKEEFFTSKMMADLDFVYDDKIHGKREKIEFARID
jgi:hypothetical protein